MGEQDPPPGDDPCAWGQVLDLAKAPNRACPNAPLRQLRDKRYRLTPD
ncbi:hypothetical protein [Saccharothrix sp.]|nr:hypothetical protein [Saccharothrix sp.]